MKISACAIVKNEAQNIRKSLESYKDAVDEIVIVDTGSDDDTVEICRSLGARVLYFEWCNDFAAAKNFALENAKGDWIIFLDADEWFVPMLKRSFLLNLLQRVDPREDVVSCTMCEYNPLEGKVRQRTQVTRIFRNSPEIRYKGSIHEDIYHSGRSGGNMFFHRRTDLEIYHSGYSPQVIEAKTKRNIEILYDIYNKGKDINTELYFYLFRENAYIGNIEEAIKFYNIFIEQSDADRIIKETTVVICVYEEMYVLMANNRERFTQEEIFRHLETAYNKYPFLPMHSYLLGVEKLRLCDYQHSYDCIARAIKLNKEYTKPYLNKFHSVLADAYYKMGYICQEQGKTADALENYLQAVKLANDRDLILVLQKIVNIIDSQPQEEIILFLTNIIDTNKKENIEIILNILKKTRLHKVFVYFALKYNREFDGQNETTYIAMILTGQAELAVETAIEAWKNSKREICSDEKPEDTTDYCDWHLDYAVIAILYSKRLDLYNKYKEFFSEEQGQIIDAYLTNSQLESISSDLRIEVLKVFGNINYIFSSDELLRFKNIFRL